MAINGSDFVVNVGLRTTGTDITDLIKQVQSGFKRTAIRVKLNIDPVNAQSITDNLGKNISAGLSNIKIAPDFAKNNGLITGLSSVNELLDSCKVKIKGVNGAKNVLKIQAEQLKQLKQLETVDTQEASKIRISNSKAETAEIIKRNTALREQILLANQRATYTKYSATGFVDSQQSNIEVIANRNSAAATELTTKLQAVKTALSAVDNASNDNNGVANALKAADIAAKEFESSLKRVQKELDKAVASDAAIRNKATTIYTSMSGENYSNNQKSVISRISNDDVVVQKQLNDLLEKELLIKTKIDKAGGIGSAEITQVNTLIEAHKNLTNAIKDVTGAKREQNKAEQETINFNNLSQQADNYYKRYQVNIQNNIALSRKWNDLLAKIGDSSQWADSKEAREALTNLTAESRAAGVEVNTLGQKLKNLFGQHLSTAIAMLGVNALRQGLRQVYQNVVELDKALVEFNKVADLTGSGLEKIAGQAYEIGRSIGRTGIDVMNAATEFKRAGYDITKSMEMSKAALVMTNVGDGIEDTAEAASVLIAALRGFKLADSDAMSVVDLINQVSNTAPINFEDIAEGLTRVSGTLHQTGTDINQTVGLLTGGFSQLRNIEKVSTGLIMISQRLRGIDEDGSVIDGLAPKLQEEFAKIGITIEDAEGNLRSTYDVLKDYAAVYDELTPKQKQFYGELMAGNRQVTVLNAIIQQWTDVEGAISQATDSLGSAERENEIFTNSILGKTRLLASSFQSLSTNILDSSFVKKTVDGLTWITTELENFLKLINKIPGASASFNVLSGVLGGVLGAKGKGNSNEYALYLSNRVDAKAIKLRGSQNIISPKRSWKRQVAMVWKHRKNEMINLCCKKTA